MDDYHAHIRDMIEMELPDHAHILMPRGWRELLILVSWKLPSTAKPRHARTHMVRIVVSGAALGSYAAGSADDREACDRRLVTWLRTQIAEFDARPSDSIEVDLLPVTWQIESQQLFG
jgi:hypothetical protein